MDNCSLPENLPDTENSIEKQLAVPRELTRAEFDTAKKMIGAKLQSAMHSLRHSVSSIHLLLAAQNPADMTASAANKMQRDLASLLVSGNRLAQLALMLQQGFSGDHGAAQQRTEREIANVVAAIAQHRTAVQDNAIALTEAALDKARSRRSVGDAGGADRRTPR